MMRLKWRGRTSGRAGGRGGGAGPGLRNARLSEKVRARSQKLHSRSLRSPPHARHAHASLHLKLLEAGKATDTPVWGREGVAGACGVLPRQAEQHTPTRAEKALD